MTHHLLNRYERAVGVSIARHAAQARSAAERARIERLRDTGGAPLTRLYERFTPWQGALTRVKAAAAAGQFGVVPAAPSPPLQQPPAAAEPQQVCTSPRATAKSRAHHEGAVAQNAPKRLQTHVSGGQPAVALEMVAVPAHADISSGPSHER